MPPDHGANAGNQKPYSGREFQIPLPGGEAKPMRLAMPAEHDISIYLATLSPKMLQLDSGRRRRNFSRYNARSSASAPERFLDVGAGCCRLEGMPSLWRPGKSCGS
ncbi:hypothetical protein [Streptomyces sp. NBC_01390]|uniref:hypothetical protein n=1 Tax=Streptomyces sp. NBC_01390 TaxID=2903850 RepID=UPI00386950C4